jgi:MFS family permease
MKLKMARGVARRVLGELRGRQERFLAISMSILYLGTGLSYSLLALYLTRYLHMGATTYGVGMSVAAIFGIVSGPIMGHLSDRVNGYSLYAVLVWVMAAATAAVTVADKWVALALLCVLLACARGSATVITTLIGRAVAPDRRVRYRAVLKTLANTAMVIGLGLGSLVLAVNSMVAFRVGFAVEASTLLIAGILVRSASPDKVRDDRSGHPENAGSRPAAAGKSRFAVLHDGRFAVLAALNSVLMLYMSMLAVAVPLWVSSRLHAPLWLVSVAMVVNTVGLIIFQIPASRPVSGVRSAALACRRGGILFGVAAVMFPLAAIAHSLAWALIVIVLLSMALVGGEVFYSAGSWELVYRLAPEELLGQYQGVFGAGLDLSMIAAPTLFAWLTSVRNTLGWFIVAAVFVAAGALLVPATARGDNATVNSNPEAVSQVQ